MLDPGTTFSAYFHSYFRAHGMSVNEATRCLDFAKAHPNLGIMEGRWEDDASILTEPAMLHLQEAVSHVTLVFIDTRDDPIPWYRSCFH